MHSTFLFFTGLFLFLTNSEHTLVNRFLPMHTVCVDPGHGGDDSGAISNDLTEAEVNLNIAEKLKTLLENNHDKVVLTRNDNGTSLSNSKRADICNQAHADIAIAIHLNATTDTTTDYTQGLYGTVKKDKKLTDIIHQSLINKLHIAVPPDNREVTDFGDNVLLKTKMPATLQETVFISSSNEYAELKTDQRQQQIANALFDGITNWFTLQH